MTSGVSPDSEAQAPRDVIAEVAPLVPAWRVDRTFDYRVPGDLVDDVEVGSLVRVLFGNRRVRAVVVALRHEPEGLETLNAVLAVVSPAPVATGATIELASWVALRYVVPRARVLGHVVPPRVRINASRPIPVSAPTRTRDVAAFEGGDALATAITSRSSGVWCIRALPGDERVGILTDLVALGVGEGQGTALVLVPEVQGRRGVLDELQTHIPEIVRVDSGVPDRDRSEAWFRLALGHPVGGGGRAAALAPAADLRVIVVDDEHHPSYKEDRSPRYDARRVAVRRAHLERCVCVFVSPCPSVETGWATSSGAFGAVVPSRTDERRRRPLVELVEPDRSGGLSRALQRRMAEALERNERVGLLVPGKGFARAVWCTTCRRSLRCPRCEEGLFFDRAPRQVRCPRCSLVQAPPDRCPSCGATEFALVGWGSERFAEQLGKAFPRARVARVDPFVIDEMRDRRDEIAEADIYVTTWVGTKLSVRPPVSLVGVVNADWLIRRPDFRAAERAYQALVEMAGWAGPADHGGRLVVETLEPAHHAVQGVVRADYRFFLDKELDQRRELSYPPFTELIRVSAGGQGGRTLLEEIAARARPLAVQVLGPVRIASKQPSWLEVLIKTSDAEMVAGELRDILAGATDKQRVRVDVDPR